MKLSSNFKQIVRYFFYAIVTTFVNWLTYSAVIFALKQGTVSIENAQVLLANTVAWIVAVLFSFFVNKLRVFHSTGWHITTLLWELVTFFSTRFAAGFIEVGLATCLVALGLDQPLFGVEGMLSKLIITPILMLINYFFGKFLIFRKPKKK